MTRYFIFSLIILSASLLDCDSDVKSDCGLTLCTMEYRMIMVSVKRSSDNSPVVLSDFKVFRVSDNKDITKTDNNLTDNLGFYPLVNDSDTDWLRNKNVEIEFQGYLNNSLQITRRFIVTADCCHVSLVSGESTVFI
jgi:hypothetical protein